MPTFEVDVEGKTYEVDAPDTNTAWAWAYTTHRQQFGMKSAAPPEKTGMLRAAADIPVQVGRGVAVGVKALSDVFGADNPVSRAASGVEDFLGGLLSAQAKNDQAEIARIMKEAQDKGVGDQVSAAVKAFATAPVDMLSQALGTAVPVIAGGLAGSIARLGAAGVGAIGTGVGAAMGAGTVKGQIYDAVKQELLANKVPEAEAEKRAQEAQSYGGKNLDQILMGAGIGAAEAAFGAERILTGLLRKGAVKPSALPAKYRIPTAAGMEAVPEMAQAAQEQVAQNIALQREGYDVPTMRGVVGQAALEGLAGAGLGAITGAVERTEAAKPEAEARKPQEAAGPQQAEAEAPKPVTGEAGIVRPEEETAISREVAEAAEPEIEPTRQIKSAELMSPPTPQEISQSVASTEQDVPSEGMVRMYHGGRGPEELTGPVWFTLDRRNAEGWAKRDPSMNVWYVDVPERALVEQYGYATIKQARDDGYVPVPNLELPEDFAKNRKPLPLAEKKAPAPAGVEEGAAIRPEVSPEPGIAEDRQRAETVEPVAQAAAPEPVATEAAAKSEEVPSAPEVVPKAEIATGKESTLWRYNEATGMWNPQRKVTQETQNQWLNVFQSDDPTASFLVSDKRPKGNPKIVPRVSAEKQPAGEVRPEGRVQPEGEGRAVGSDEEAGVAKRTAKKAARSVVSEPRGMDHEGRPTDGKPILPGDVFETSSGRTTTPYPKQKSLKYSTQWLIDNAVAEAESRGDRFNARGFAAEKPGRDGVLPDASQASMLEYLFGQQPDVVPSILKPLRPEPKKSLRATTAQQVADFEQTLRTALNKFGLKDVGVKLIDGMTEEGSYAQQLIRIAADSANPIRTLRHEAIHALRELGFFTPQQWQSLSKMAKDKWIDQYLKQRNVDGKPLKAGEESRYDAYMREYEGDMEKITEEAVADAFADFDATKPPAGLMQALLTRLRNLFQAIKSALTKVESPEQIFGKVERGELAAAEGVQPTEEARKSLRKEEPRPAPTTAGQSALDTINQLGMGVKEPEKNLYQKAKDTFKQMGESPSGTKAEIKEAVRKFFANTESKVFSPDARWDSDIKNGLRKDMKPVEEIIGASLLVSQSQAVGPDGVATRAMLIGGAKYDAEVMKWVAYENKDANEIVKAKVLDDIAAKYGLTRDEASQVAHTYLVAANYEGILKRNAKLEDRIEKARSKAKELENLIPILTMRYQNAIAELGEMDLEKDARRLEREFDQLNKKTKDDITKLNNEVDDLQAALVFVSEDQAAMVEPGKAIADSIPEVKKITEIWNEQRRMVKDAMVFGGLWTPEYADALMDNAAYVPFYREKQIEADEGPRVFMRGLQVKAKEQKLKGSKTAVNDVFENMALWQQYAINRAIRNHKMVQSIDVGKTIQAGDRKMAEQVSEPKRGMNVVRLWREGKQEFYEVADPYYVEAFQSLGAVYIEPIKYFTAISNILRKTVVMYPLFSLGQLTQDSVAAIFSSGLKPQYAFKIPFLAVQEFIKTMKGWSTTHDELANYGAVGVRDFNANVAKEDAEITANIKAPKGTAGKIKYMLERIAMSADNAVRQATYIASQDAGLSKAEALEKAFEIINFRRRGSSKLLQLMGQTVPFFYAYLSAQRVAYKTLTLSGISPTERMAALETLAQTTAAVMALSFLYAMANGDDEEYKKTPATVRDRSLMIPGSGGVRIPLRPDFFLFPKVIAEHTYQLITDEGYSDGAKFRKSMADLFANATLSPNVVPQIVKPTFEAAINYSFFEGKPIIGYFEQNKEAGRQFNESTSEFAKFLGRFGASPQMVDHLVRGYFGSVGGLGLWGTNFFIEGEPGVPRPELTAHDMLTTMPGVGAFKQKPTENALKVDFYELRDAIAKAKNTYDDMKVRSPEGLEAFLQDEKNLARLAMDKQVTKIGDHLSKIRRAIQQVAAAPEERMSASEKQERIKELRDVEMELLKAVDVKAMRAQAKL